MTITDAITNELRLGEHSYYLSHETMRDAIGAVLQVHAPYRLYGDCGHDHDENDLGVIERLDGQLVCDEDRVDLVCLACCTWEFGQTDHCASNHGTGACYPCPTVRPIAEKLGITEGES